MNGGDLVFERFVEGFILVADDAGSARVGRNKGVVNMSFGASLRVAAHKDMADVWCKLFPDLTTMVKWLTLTVNRRAYGTDGDEFGYLVCSCGQLRG
jgi:hypothetical protein